VVLFYYSAPEFATVYSERLGGEAAASSVPTPSPLLALAGIVSGLFTPDSRLLPLTAALGLVGLLLLWAGNNRAQRSFEYTSLKLTLLAWWGSILLSFSLLLIANQGVRWQHFLYPALCLGGGLALAATWRRGSAGCVVALAGLVAIISHGLFLWVWQVYDYLH
jgi:hypothetical protein